MIQESDLKPILNAENPRQFSNFNRDVPWLLTGEFSEND
jgi:hypothetical protein